MQHGNSHMRCTRLCTVLVTRCWVPGYLKEGGRCCRWNSSMEQGPLKKEHWRKSAQWSALVRKHAQVVADDVQVADVFSKTCRAGIDKKTGVEHKCIADEVSLKDKQCCREAS